VDRHQLILWSVREGELLQEAVDYCAKRGLEFYAVNTNYPDERPEQRPNRKVTADLYIDDRNLGGLPDWGIIYQMVHTGNYNHMTPVSYDQTRRKTWWQKLLGL